MLALAEPFVTVSFTVKLPGANPCVTVAPLPCAVLSPKSHE